MKYERRGRQLLMTINQSQTLNDLFASWFLSRKTIHLLRQYKDYSVNHQFVPLDTLLLPGDQLLIKAYDDDDGTYAPVYHDIDIAYEDDILLIVNKPAGLPVFPDHPDDTHSLANYVAGYYSMNGDSLPVRFIHRIDNDTSGLVIFCKCQLFQSYMDHLIANRQIQKKYWALVEGTFKDQELHTIDQPIGRDRHVSGKMRIAKNGKQAITRYRCLENYDHAALVECELVTGRRHQIRVHLAAIHHPLLGDVMYNLHPGKEKRQALHAHLVSFVHPLTQESITVEASASLSDDETSR